MKLDKVCQNRIAFSCLSIIYFITYMTEILHSYQFCRPLVLDVNTYTHGYSLFLLRMHMPQIGSSQFIYRGRDHEIIMSVR